MYHSRQELSIAEQKDGKSPSIHTDGRLISIIQFCYYPFPLREKISWVPACPRSIPAFYDEGEPWLILQHLRPSDEWITSPTLLRTICPIRLCTDPIRLTFHLFPLNPCRRGIQPARYRLNENQGVTAILTKLLVAIEDHFKECESCTSVCEYASLVVVCEHSALTERLSAIYTLL